MADFTWASSTPQHAQAPFEIATGGLEERMKLSGVRKAKADSIHFRQLGTISGDLGMVHIAISSDIGQYQDTMSKVCQMPAELRKEIDNIIIKNTYHDVPHDKPTLKLNGKRFRGTGNSSSVPPRDAEQVRDKEKRSSESKYYDTVLKNLEDECEMLKTEVEDMFLIWFSSFNRPGTAVDDDSVIGIELRSTDYDEGQGDVENNELPRVDRGVDPGLLDRSGTDSESVESQKENWRYWLVRKLEGKWPPIYKEMPKYDDGRVKIDLWNMIVRKINRYYDRHGLDGYVDPDEQKTIRTKRKKRKAKEKKGLLVRMKRFLFTLLAIAVAAISSIVFTEYEVNRLAETAESNLDSSIAVMEKHESRLNIDEATIKNLNSSIQMVMTKVQRIAHRLRADELVQEISLIMRSFFGEQRRIVGGLAALSHHRLPPQLLNMKALTSTLVGLRSKVERQGMRLGVDKFHDIFGLDCSYAIYQNGTVW